MIKTIDEVVAEAAIRSVQISYCRAVDRMDFNLLRACFHPDATADYGFFSGGIDEFIAMAKTSLKSFSTTSDWCGAQALPPTCGPSTASCTPVAA